MGMNAFVIATGRMTPGTREALSALSAEPFDDCGELPDGARACIEFPCMNTSQASRDLARSLGVDIDDVATHALDNARIAKLTIDDFGPAWGPEDNFLFANLGEAQGREYAFVLAALAREGFDLFWRAG